MDQLKASRSTSDAQDPAASGGARWREPFAFLDVQGDLRCTVNLRPLR